MSTQVLARKWRPKAFSQVIGQEHVVRALSHALSSKRLHHAYLFTGTRGVGKTTLSRLLAKALNCVGPDGRGDITATPCGVCNVCLAIDSGRFIDYIEMDAASNRGVDEMAQLLEQAIYAPSGARFKVYMIDEVHMLTGHAFNAMLKTLEEPPEHLKFILATTDPQKIPVTVLSRCLQFNLKQMPPTQIVAHLAEILSAEQISFEAQALPRLARAASGSMRDALSLTDQAIAYSGGTLTDNAVQAMLGTLDETYIIRLLEALANGDGAELLAVADEIAERSLSMPAALSDLAVALQRIAIIQAVPQAGSQDWPALDSLVQLASRLSPEEVQLDYDIAVRGRIEMPMAPDEYAGFTMTLLRMLAFAPDNAASSFGPTPGAMAKPQRSALTSVTSQALDSGHSSVAALPPQATARSTSPQPVEAPERILATAAPRVPKLGSDQMRAAAVVEPSGLETPGASTRELGAVAASPQAMVVTPALATPVAAEPRITEVQFDGDWLQLVSTVRVTGLTRQLLEQAELISFENNRFELRVALKHLADRNTVERLKTALAQHFGGPVELVVRVGTVAGNTKAQHERGEREARQARAVASIESDPFVRTLVAEFDAVVVPGSIRPV